MPFPLLTIPLLTIIISQIIKLSIDGVKGNLTLAHIINDYSGMPSTHTAFVSSLITLMALSEGIASPAFAISLVFGLIIIRDALGFRRHLGTYAERLNRITVDLTPLPTRVGHKPGEVIAGCVLGVILSLILNQW